MKSSQIFILLTISFLTACTQERTVPITGIWKCEGVIRSETPSEESMAKSFGTAIAKSEAVSDSLIIATDGKYEQHNSAFGIFNTIKGTYVLSQSDKRLILTKNDGEPGTLREQEFSIETLTSDTLLLKNTEGFGFVYLRQK